MLHCKVLFGQMVSAQSIEVGVWYPILHHAGHVTFQRERRFPQRHKADHLNSNWEKNNGHFSDVAVYNRVITKCTVGSLRQESPVPRWDKWYKCVGSRRILFVVFLLETWWQWDWRDRRILSTTTQVRNTPEDLAR